ncbi:ROK family protein [Mannheimia varigena]|uniref:ROK family protein n=1 Tax=Mannheimia varigena TaxID=85404 RepID=UPI0003E31690|nr:ROK family protein [Mannheimia varigena]AHG77593.1 Transcriptional repressor of carbohydrate metabolism [Mannheimia varigena USDA-ARS-USMARC-1312]MDY2948010.1 ROK family protein [Mannheimia varigena]QLD33066.1 ROK family protein [Mannheimia varigena]
MFSDNKALHLGKIYRLIEQFELISRTDLAKLSDLAPASVTNLTKILIDNHFILERAVQNTLSRGRPSVGLAVSNFFWQLLCVTVSPHKVEISLCQLNGKQIHKQDYTISPQHYAQLDDNILKFIDNFQQVYTIDKEQLLAVSVSVVGKIDAEKESITQLGNHTILCHITPKLTPLFDCPILLSEHFQLWLLAESTVGSLISQNNVIFIELDDTVNVSVLLSGNLLHKQSKMNVDNMHMPKFSQLSDETFPELDAIDRYKLINQVTFPAIVQLIDKYLPNDLTTPEQKINLLCQKIEENQTIALSILDHITDNLAYALMNLANIFSSEKIMFNSPLLQVKEPLFSQLSVKLQKNLLQQDLNIDLVTSQYDWNSPLIACSAIKQGIYDGNLIKDSIN